MKPITNYAYSLWADGTLEVLITALDGKEFSLATMTNCDNMSEFELDNLAQEVIEENKYELIQPN